MPLITPDTRADWTQATKVVVCLIVGAPILTLAVLWLLLHHS